MKYIFLAILLSISLSADYLYQVNNTCVGSLTPNADSGWCFIETSSDSTYCVSTSTFNDYLPGYVYDINSSSCVLKHDLYITGMSEEQWHILMILFSNAIGILMLTSISYFITRV